VNKTVLFVTFAVLIALGIIGAVIILLVRPDSVGAFTTLLVTVLGLAVTASGTFYYLGQQGKQIETIKTQTNGTTSRLMDHNQTLLAENARLTQALAAGAPAKKAVAKK
jgi:hypothetical protein